MRVDIGGGTKLWFDVAGPGLAVDGPAMRARPSLLLLHGGPGFDHSMFRPWADRFADTHQVVYLDQRGHGRSDGRADGDSWRLDVWADDVHRFCEALDITRPVVFGNSFGGMVAMHYAARHPDHPSKLILSSTTAWPDVPAIGRAFERLGGPAVGDLALRFWADPAAHGAEYLATCLPLYTRRDHTLAQSRDAAEVNRDVMVHFILGEQRSMDLRPGLGSVRCPTLVLAGSDDPVCPPSDLDRIVSALPAGLARSELLDDCGHGTYRDQPDRTEAVVRGFLGT